MAVTRPAPARDGAPGAVVGLIAAESVRAELARQLAGVSAVEWCGDADAALARVRRGGVAVVVTEPADERGHSAARVVVALLAHRPPPALVLYAAVNGATLPQLRAVLAPGLAARCVVRPHEPAAPAVREALAGDVPPGAEPVLLHRLVARAPAGLRVFAALAALNAPRRRGVHQIAAWSGVTARTVERRLRRAAWPPARTLVQSCAALDAAWLMTQYGWSARRVHEARGLPHASSVTRLLARYCGTRPRTLREDGGFAAALAHVLRALPERR